MRCLDLFCGAGGCSVGYHRAGFTEIVGVDIKPQPHYPFTFIQGDALDYLRDHGKEYDFIHASPPCQAYSVTRNLHQNKKLHPALVNLTRDFLNSSGKPYVMENVIGSPVANYVINLCGLMFGLSVIRHRLFECSEMVRSIIHPVHPKHLSTGTNSHGNKKAGRSGYSSGEYGLVCVAGNNFNLIAAKKAMGIDWMTRKEIAQAIPPAYTQYIGEQILEHLQCE